MRGPEAAAEHVAQVLLRQAHQYVIHALRLDPSLRSERDALIWEQGYDARTVGTDRRACPYRPGDLVAAHEDPNGFAVAAPGRLYTCPETGARWLKVAGVDAYGWEPLRGAVEFDRRLAEVVQKTPWSRDGYLKAFLAAAESGLAPAELELIARARAVVR